MATNLTAKQTRFCEEYLKDFNATRAAIAAGYSKDTASVIGWENLRKPYLKAYITQRIAELSMSADEATKLISDIAKGNLGNYFITKKVEYTPRIEMGLKKLIQQVQAEIMFEDEFAEKADFTIEEKTQHLVERALKKRQILRYQIELKKNPAATRIINGPVEWRETVELDMVKLVSDRAGGRIKSITPTANGTKVELFSAPDALVNVAKMHGLFAKDNAQLKPEIIAPLNDKQVDNILSELRKSK